MTTKKNIWKKFEEPPVEFPEKIVSNLIHSFDDVAEGLAKLHLIRVDGTSKMFSNLEGCEFQFKLVLISEQISGFSFEVFRFGYSVSIYPVDLIIENEIGEELGLHEDFGGNCMVTLLNEEEFSIFIEAALKSYKFSSTVGGLIKIARRESEQNIKQRPKF